MASDKKDGSTADSERPADLNLDGIKVLDMSYYNLLGVRADATDAQLRSAYKKAALKNHPDRNRDDPNAEQKFQEIGEAYQVLSDSNLRAVYDRRGKKGDEAKPEEGFEDPGQLFAKLFGGERFVDWIGEISLGRDFSKAMDISMTEEEKAAMQAEATAAQAGASGTTSAIVAESATTPTTPVSPATPAGTASSAATSANGQSKDATTAAASSTSVGSSELHKPSNSGTSTPSSTTVGASTPGSSKAAQQPPSKPSNKLTPEQRKQMDQLAEERRKNETERIQLLVNKLKDRVRPFVQAASPGDPTDVECKRWEEKIREEIDDLKSESFGVELCRLIGQIYVTKSHAYLKAHRSPLSNFLGISAWWGKMKDRGATVKEGWQFLSTTMDVQQAMTAMEKQQASGATMPEEEMAKLEEAVMGKVMLVSWRGTRFEVASVLRQVVDGTLVKEPGVANVETMLVNRAKAILIIVMKNVQVDETDEERREMERLVAQAAQKKPKKSKK